MRVSLLAASVIMIIPAIAAAQPGAPQPYPPQPQPVPQPQPYAPAPAPSPYVQPVVYTEPTGPVRDGITFEADIGIGWTMLSPEVGEGDTRTGLSGINLALGGWVAPETAILVRISGSSYFLEDDTQIINGMLGLTLQQMVGGRAFIGGGIGIGVLTDDNDATEPEGGFALDLRAGYELYQSRKNAFHLALEVQPNFLDGGRVTSVGLQLGWQHL